MAGKGARDLAERRYVSRKKLLPIVIICGGLIALTGVSGISSGSPIVFIVLIVAIGAVLKMFGPLIDKSVKEERRAVRGAKGEELIAQILSELGDDDFAIFHDLACPYGNIDHLVLSKESGLFLIETKAHGGRVSIVNGEIIVNQRKPEKDFIGQVLSNTVWLKQQLEARLPTKVWVNSILVFSNAYVEDCGSIRNVQIIPKLFLLKTIRRQSRSRQAFELWENKEVLSDIFPSVWFPPKAEVDPSSTERSQSLVPQQQNNVPPLPSGSNEIDRYSSVGPHTKDTLCASVPTSESTPDLQTSPRKSVESRKGLPTPIRLTPLGAIYRLRSSDGQKPSENQGKGNVSM
jgi:hypothetical protein